MDFSWFGTIPGMLITGGVLLLIISLIIFISTMGKKGKKDKNSVEEKSLEGAKEMVSESSLSNSVSAPVIDAIPTGTDSITGMPNVAFATPTPVQPEVVSPMSGTAPVQPEVAPPMPGAVPVQPEVAQPMPEAAPVQPEVVQPMPEAAPVQPEMVQPMPEVAPVQPEVVPPMPEVAPVQPEVVQPMPEVAPVQSEVVQPMPETAPVQPEVAPQMSEVVSVSTEPTNQTVSIYGGASPSVSKSDIETTETHQIYGGANPLENTQSISINDINQAAASQVAAANEPQIEQVVVPVQTEVVQPTPEVTSVINPTVSNVETQPQVSVVDVNQPIVEPYNPNNV